MSLAIENLKFTIFGSGHDYTLNNSGTGEGAIWFSHPFMAKGSRAYAGMYYFLVADENGDLIDAVKDDIAHCTFTPALGDTFDTVGEQEIRVDYRREYIYDEETLVIEKHLKQTITVVDHGAVSTSYFNQSIYEDGYCYVHPMSDSVSRSNGWWLQGSFKKISSLPWGTTSISNISTNIEDASEIAFADFSQMTTFKQLFYGCNKLTNISNFELIDMTTITSIEQMFGGCSALADISPLRGWNTSHITNVKGFLWGTGIVDTNGLQNFRFDSTTDLTQFFYACTNLTDLNGIAGWDVSGIELFNEMFYRDFSLTDLRPLSHWDMTGAISVMKMFASYAGGSRCGKLVNLVGLQGWDVSNIRVFSYMFADQFWLNDISSISGWDVSNGQNFDKMFANFACTNLNDISGWDMSNALTINYMFGMEYKVYSAKIDKYIIEWTSTEYIDYEDNLYMSYQVKPPNLTALTQDASAVSGWDLSSALDTHAFFDGTGTRWINIPSWN